MDRKIVGIDLGTTNCAVAYIEPEDPRAEAQVFQIPQLIAPGEIECRETLPSFHYQPAEMPQESLRLPWGHAAGRNGGFAVGVFARDYGGDAPERLIASAKSWLSHSGVDRTAALLPWHGAADLQKYSPAEATAFYLEHIRNAWDFRFPNAPLASQEVVVTIPASFDEVARELTIGAARKAGLPRVFLLEEPQAAFYAWTNRGLPQEERQPTQPGEQILVCDVGGGTTDFTLIEVKSASQKDERAQGGAQEGALLHFHRFAVGDHLILGGDNLDLALAHFVEQRLGRKLPAREWSALVRRCRSAKEALLGPDAPETYTLSVAGAGARLVGGSLQIELHRQEVASLLLEGFLPHCSLGDKPSGRTSGFQEFGLPFARDPAVTRHLGAFLGTHTQKPPGFVLFNGGLFQSRAMQNRLLEVMEGWFGTRPIVLENEKLDLAVALGAACYGRARMAQNSPEKRSAGSHARVRITGGLARSYYLGIEHGQERMALCLAPAGLEEGQCVELKNEFGLLVRRPVEFPLYFSSTRTSDRPGDLVPVHPEEMSSLPPIRTVLRSKSSSGQGEEVLRVHLNAKLTEIGVLELWCSEIEGGRRWKLPFDIRSSYPNDLTYEDESQPGAVFDEPALEACRELIHAVFAAKSASETGIIASKRISSVEAESLVSRLESAVGEGRWEWPPALLRSLWEELLACKEGGRRNAIHEARWLNLLGFCLRPGYGMAADDWRVAQTWHLAENKIIHERNELCRAEWWILWRRIAGGLSAGQQRALAAPLVSAMRKSRAKGGKLPWGAHESAEILRLLASFEHLSPEIKEEIGNGLGNDQVSIWALGRLGARVPLYGPLNAVVRPEAAEAWAQRLMQADPGGNPDLFFSLMLLARQTGDRYRDLSVEIRERILEWMKPAPAHLRELIRAGGKLAQQEGNQAFGERLPRGVRLIQAVG